MPMKPNIGEEKHSSDCVIVGPLIQVNFEK